MDTYLNSFLHLSKQFRQVKNYWLSMNYFLYAPKCINTIAHIIQAIFFGLRQNFFSLISQIQRRLSIRRPSMALHMQKPNYWKNKPEHLQRMLNRCNAQLLNGKLSSSHWLIRPMLRRTFPCLRSVHVCSKYVK